MSFWETCETASEMSSSIGAVRLSFFMLALIIAQHFSMGL